MPKTPIDDCFRPGAPLMRHDEAIELLKSRVVPVVGMETVVLTQSAGRVIAQAVKALHPVPGHTNSAVDGYAFASSNYDSANGTTLPVEGRAAAGHPLSEPVRMDRAVRIFTGAVMPGGLDTVAMQEDVTTTANTGATAVTLPAGLKPGANVRKAGEDVAVGTTLFDPGSIIRPQDLAALASIGLPAVTCYKRLEVAIVSTGDEVIAPGLRELSPGEVYDANSPMLQALAATAGANVTNLGIWPDQPDEIKRRLSDAATRYDVILTSGGASKGEEDHLARVLGETGSRHFWQIAVKPGRPMMFGTLRSGPHEAVMIGLPGNPVAVFVCFLMYVYPLLRALAGASWPEPQRIMLPAAFEFRGRKHGRREFWRGMSRLSGATLSVDKYLRDGSGLISGLRAADGLIDIPENHGDVLMGAPVAFIPFTEFGILGR